MIYIADPGCPDAIELAALCNESSAKQIGRTQGTIAFFAGFFLTLVGLLVMTPNNPSTQLVSWLLAAGVAGAVLCSWLVRLLVRKYRRAQLAHLIRREALIGVPQSVVDVWYDVVVRLMTAANRTPRNSCEELSRHIPLLAQLGRSIEWEWLTDAYPDDVVEAARAKLTTAFEPKVREMLYQETVDARTRYEQDLQMHAARAQVLQNEREKRGQEARKRLGLSESEVPVEEVG